MKAIKICIIKAELKDIRDEKKKKREKRFIKMQYKNPVIPGFFPDPSVCSDGHKFYLVCSSFQYFPGVPLFESEDLVSWKQIGHVLTRESQLPLQTAKHSEGIFAPTIRFYEGRFYMVTTNVSAGGNFYVYTDDIYGEWSEPIFVEQGGIDPSLYFESGKAYFMSNGEDDEGNGGITQCEIDIKTGKKLTKSQCIWKGNGGRYLESPHLYKIQSTYYLMAAEGGTEYGHMVVYAKGKTPYGPFENYPQNPVLTNRNLGGYPIQGCGHGDLIEDQAGNWWMLHLAFRTTGRWDNYHITGREVYLVPVTFDEEGWFTVGVNGTTPITIQTNRLPEIKQSEEIKMSFENTKLGVQWCYLRNPDKTCYSYSKDRLILHGNSHSIMDQVGSPTFLAIRQQQMYGSISCKVEVDEGEAGMTLYMDEEHHYDLFLRKNKEGYQIVKRLCIGDIRYEEKVIELGQVKEKATLQIELDPQHYHFSAKFKDKQWDLLSAQTRYLSTEVASGFTGVMIGLYAEKSEGTNEAVFTEFSAVMKDMKNLI